MNPQLEIKFRGFKTIYYLKKGCASSACEGVEIINDLAVSSVLLNSFDIIETIPYIKCLPTDCCEFFLECRGGGMHSAGTNLHLCHFPNG